MCGIFPKCLNPCFSGKWSWRERVCETARARSVVLILVLVESGLGEVRERRGGRGTNHVLILVLVESGLGDSKVEIP